jgi:hypothetical protein
MPFDHEKSRFWKRLLPTNASWWELAAAAITVVFAFRHTAISLFFARFNVSPEEIGMGLTTVALHSAVLVVALSILANWLLVGPMVYIYARFGARADRRLKTRVKRLCSSFKNGPWLAIGFLLAQQQTENGSGKTLSHGELIQYFLQESRGKVLN